MADVDIADVLLAIARRVSQSLDKLQIGEPSRLKNLLQGAAKVLNADVQGMKVKVPGVGDVGVSGQGETFSLAFGIGEITAKAKSDAALRDRLNQYLGPQKTGASQCVQMYPTSWGGGEVGRE